MARPHEAEMLHVVLDEAAVDRLRVAAEARGIEIEQLIVELLHVASWDTPGLDGLGSSVT